jgi:hypothetical protein
MLAQQVAAMSDVVAKLAAEKHDTQMVDNSGDSGGTNTIHPRRNVPPPANRSTNDRNRVEDEVPFHHFALPKQSFLKLTGDNPRIWIDKCVDHFTIFHIPECMWTTTTSLHMEDNAAKCLTNWHTFVSAVEQKFGAFDYHKAIQELLSVKQEGSVEDYTKDFEAI